MKGKIEGKAHFHNSFWPFCISQLKQKKEPEIRFLLYITLSCFFWHPKGPLKNPWYILHNPLPNKIQTTHPNKAKR